MKRIIKSLVLAYVLLLSAFGVSAQQQTVTFAGLAYSGDAATLEQRFPYSRKYEQALKARGTLPFLEIFSAIQKNPPKKFTITKNQINELKGSDQALVVSLVLGSETVSIERFGDIHKIFVLIRGQAIFFDFKSMGIVRSYPISFAYVDNLTRSPTSEDIENRVKLVFEGVGDKLGIFSRFANVLVDASIPATTPRFLQVAAVTLGPNTVGFLPDYLKSSPAVYETWLADLVSEAISSRLGVPMVPYSKGYAIGNVMSMQVADGEVFNLALPKPDYEISVNLKELRKIRYSQTAAGASFVYGAYADLKIVEPFSNTVYMDTSLKNGEVKIVPASQTHVDDFPAFYDSINAMFVKLAHTISGVNKEWIKSAANSPSIAEQIVKTKELIELCK